MAADRHCSACAHCLQMRCAAPEATLYSDLVSGALPMALEMRQRGRCGPDGKWFVRKAEASA